MVRWIFQDALGFFEAAGNVKIFQGWKWASSDLLVMVTMLWSAFLSARVQLANQTQMQYVNVLSKEQ